MEHACIICTSKTNLWLNPQTGTAYFYCPACECVFRDPATLLSADEEKKRYQQHNNSLEEPGYVAMFERFIEEAVTPYVPQGSRILDFGAGPANPPVMATLLARSGFQCDVYDPYFYPAVPSQGTRYDAIISTEVFEHLSAPVATLKQIISQVLPGGCILLMTNFHPNDEQAFMRWWYWRDDTHVVFYTHTTMQILAEICGCTIVYMNNKNICVLRMRVS